MAASLIFDVDITAPAELSVCGMTWFRRPEFHVTTFTPQDLASATGLSEHVLEAAAAKCHDELRASRPITFDGRVARAWADDGRQSLVAFCDVEGLDAVYRQLSDVVGAALPPPPAHVTLYTAAPGMKGIGLGSNEEVQARTTFLLPCEANEVLSSLRGQGLSGRTQDDERPRPAT